MKRNNETIPFTAISWPREPADKQNFRRSSSHSTFDENEKSHICTLLLFQSSCHVYNTKPQLFSLGLNTEPLSAGLERSIICFSMWISLWVFHRVPPRLLLCDIVNFVQAHSLLRTSSNVLSQPFIFMGELSQAAICWVDNAHIHLIFFLSPVLSSDLFTWMRKSNQVVGEGSPLIYNANTKAVVPWIYHHPSPNRRCMRNEVISIGPILRHSWPSYPPPYFCLPTSSGMAGGKETQSDIVRREKLERSVPLWDCTFGSWMQTIVIFVPSRLYKKIMMEPF